MFKVTPNPSDNIGTPAEEFLDKETADRAFAHYFPPTNDKPSKRRRGRRLSLSTGIDPEALLANASEAILSISAIAAKLADDAPNSNRSVALALSRIADGGEYFGPSGRFDSGEGEVESENVRRARGTD